MQGQLWSQQASETFSKSNLNQEDQKDRLQTRRTENQEEEHQVISFKLYYSMLQDLGKIFITEKSPSRGLASPLLPKIENMRTPLIKRTNHSKGIPKVQNKVFILKSITSSLLPGEVWESYREEIAERLEKWNNGHFILLLKPVQGKVKYGGVYMLGWSQKIFKVHSWYNTPNVISWNMVKEHLRFTQDLEFEELVGTSEFHNLTDAIVLRNSNWGVLQNSSVLPLSEKGGLEIKSYKSTPDLHSN